MGQLLTMAVFMDHDGNITIKHIWPYIVNVLACMIVILNVLV